MEIEQETGPLGEKSGVRVEFRLEGLTVAELDRAEVEILGEVKMVLLENPFLKLTPNFHFSCKGKKIKEFEPLSLQLDSSASHFKIDLLLETFNDRTARQHVSAVAQFLENPKHFLNESFLEFNTLLGRNDYL